MSKQNEVEINDLPILCPKCKGSTFYNARGESLECVDCGLIIAIFKRPRFWIYTKEAKKFILPNNGILGDDRGFEVKR